MTIKIIEAGISRQRNRNGGGVENGLPTGEGIIRIFESLSGGGGKVQVKVNLTRPKSPLQFEDEQKNVAMDSDPG